MVIPNIEKSERRREYDLYSQQLRVEVVKAYLFDGLSHRRLDSDVLGLNPDESRGWQSMGILHFLGLKDPFKGLFSGMTVEETINELKLLNDSSYDEIISILESIEFNESVNEDISSENATEYIVLKEGQKKQVFTTRYERKPQLRKQAIEIHGTSCMACGFNFEEVYGSRGKNYIEVHHVKPLSDENEESEVNPSTDLIVVCANCHRIIHRKRDKILSLDELKSLIQKNES